MVLPPASLAELAAASVPPAAASVPLFAVQPFLPLVLAALLALPILLAVEVDRVERVLRRLSVVTFGGYVDRTGRKQVERERRLRAAHVPTTYRAYAATTICYAMVGAVVGGILGLYVLWGALRVLAIDEATMREHLPTAVEFLSSLAGLETLTPLQLLGLMLASGLTFGLVSGIVTYYVRWWWPEHVAATRRRTIEATMPQSIAFMYALSRSGMAFPKVLGIMASHRRIYGAAAAEVDVAVRQMDLFGRDMITAIQRMGRRTPSDQFREFAENLASVLQSGRSLAAFLDAQYEDFQEEAEAQQERLLDLVSTLAEAYVTVFVVGPLLLITILVIIGIAGADTLTALQVFIYFLLPVGNFAFILYLDAVTERFGRGETVEALPRVATGLGDVRRAGDAGAAVAGDDGAAGDGSPGADGPAVTDGGESGAARAAGVGSGGGTGSGGGAGRSTARPGPSGGPTGSPTAGDRAERRVANLERLAIHHRLRWLRERLGSPVRTVVERPVAILYVTVPIAVFGTVFRLALADSLSLDVFDDLAIQATLFVVATFAVVFEIHRRRIAAIEAAVPDFLDRLASVNEAGLSVVDSIGRVRRSELGALDPEVDRIWADVQWGADLKTALQRFERRVRTRTISRVVALLSNAMDASGDISRVLRIAASQAKADRRLKRQRRQEMLSYVLVVYISFGVFLVIIAALDAVLIPNLPDASVAPDPGATGQAVPGGMGALEGLGTIDTDAYRLVFFHTALIQGLLSGVVAGQMASGDVRDGAKHAAILMSIAYGAFLVI